MILLYSSVKLLRELIGLRASSAVREGNGLTSEFLKSKDNTSQVTHDAQGAQGNGHPGKEYENGNVA